MLGAAGLLVAGASPAAAETEVAEPSTFTSAFTVMATPDAVVNPEGVAAPGEPGATGTFDFRINSDEEVICYDITLTGVTPPFASPAKTATHVHAAPAGKPGPPRIAFPNPTGSGEELTSSGCLKGPFTTGVVANGADTGEGFSLAAIEADPASFSADTHTQAFAAGAGSVHRRDPRGTARPAVNARAPADVLPPDRGDRRGPAHRKALT